MLPILRQNESKNIIRNDHLDIDSEQEMLNKFKVFQKTLHSNSQLTSPNIFKQHKITSRSKTTNLYADSYEHRIKVKDITQVKRNNEMEIKNRKRNAKRKDAKKQEILDSKRTAQLESQIDLVAEQLALDEMEDERRVMTKPPSPIRE